METFKWFASEITSQFAYAAGNILWNILLFGFLGFAGGIALILIGRKRGWFRREFRVWSLFAKLNYPYLPLLLMVFGGITGSFYGVKKTADHFVEKTATPLARYAQEYASNIQAYLPEPQWAREEDMTLDDMIVQGMAEQGGLKPGSLASLTALAINYAVIEHVLDELGVPELVRDPIGALRALREATYVAAMFNEMTPRLQSVCGHFIWLKYKVVLFFFLPFLLLPLGEYLLHRLYKGGRQRMNGGLKTPGSMVQAGMFVVVSLVFVACGKEDDRLDPVVPIDESFISAKYNGNFVKSSQTGATIVKIGDIHISGDSISVITIAGRTEFGNQYSFLSLQLISVAPLLAGKVYSKTSEKCDDLTTVEECAIIGFTTVDDRYDDQEYSNAEQVMGNPQLKFDVLEFKIGGRLKGTFSGTIIGSKTGEKINVTEGEFFTYIK